MGLFFDNVVIKGYPPIMARTTEFLNASPDNPAYVALCGTTGLCLGDATLDEIDQYFAGNAGKRRCFFTMVKVGDVWVDDHYGPGSNSFGEPLGD